MKVILKHPYRSKFVGYAYLEPGEHDLEDHTALLLVREGVAERVPATGQAAATDHKTPAPRRRRKKT